MDFLHSYLTHAAMALAEGKLVIFPTETVYGLGANALDPQAVRRIYAAKGRPAENPLILHGLNWDSFREVTHEGQPAPVLKRLTDAFWPGPLTLVVPASPKLNRVVTGGLATVALRSPRHPLARQLLSACPFPIAAPSANRFTELSPTSLEQVSVPLLREVAVALDGGPCEVGLESTIVSWDGESLFLLRPGGIPRARLEAVAGTPLAHPSSTPNPTAPGQYPKHYAPRTPLHWAPPFPQEIEAAHCGLLQFGARKEALPFRAIEALSESGDLAEASQRLYAALWRLDQAELKCIFVTPFPTEGLGEALLDRITRAMGRG